MRLRQRGGDRGALAQSAPTLINGALMALLYFGLSIHEITFFTRIREAGFDPKTTAFFISLAILGPFLCLLIVKALERRIARWADPLVMIAVANFAGFQILAIVLERINADSQRDRVCLSLTIVATSALNSAAMALVTSHALQAVGPVQYARLRVAGTTGYVVACLMLACEIADPRRTASLAFLALAALMFAQRSHQRSVGRRGLDSTSASLGLKGGAGRALLLGLALVMAATARPFEAAAYPFMAGIVDRPGAVLMLAVTLEVALLSRWVPREQAKHGGVGRILIAGPMAWLLIYVTFTAACISGVTWPCVVVLVLQGFNCAAQTAVQAALGLGARIQASLLIASAVGRLCGNVVLGAMAPTQGDSPAAFGLLWAGGAALALGTVVVAVLSDRVLLALANGPKDRAHPASQPVGQRISI